MPKFAIIIPTLHRPSDIKTTLASIFAGSVYPQQVIVVDQSNDGDTKKIVQEFRDHSLIEYHHLHITSLTHARNFGIQKLQSDIEYVLFLDDDVTLDKECLSELVSYVEDNDVQWGVLNISSPDRYIDVVKKTGFVLLTWSLHTQKQFVTCGWFNAMFLEQPTKATPVDRCSGCAMFFRRSVFDQGFVFAEQLQKYAFMEDVFFSYAVHKKYPQSLHYIPNAKIIHHESVARSIPVRAKVMQNIVHRFLFVQYFWLSRIGYIWTILVLGIFDLLVYKKLRVLSRYVAWLYYVIAHRNKLSLDDKTSDYNAFIFQA